MTDFVNGFSMDHVHRLKECGNEKFKAGEFQEASACYLEGLNKLKDVATEAALDAPNLREVEELLRLRVSLLLNLGLTALKREAWTECVEHCTAVLNLKPGEVKALYRRGIARQRLGLAQEGKEDLRKTLLLDPNNRDARIALSSSSYDRLDWYSRASEYFAQLCSLCVTPKATQGIELFTK